VAEFSTFLQLGITVVICCKARDWKENGGYADHSNMTLVFGKTTLVTGNSILFTRCRMLVLI